MRRGAVVYDPDGINPYGREVALAIAQSRPVTLLLACDATWVPTACRTLPVLPGNRGGHRLGQGLRLLRGLGLVSWRCLFRREALVAVWTRSWVDNLLFLLLARLGNTVVVVVHNPISRVRLPPLKAWSTRRLWQGASAITVHGERLAAQTAQIAPDQSVLICDHPPFRHWWPWASAQLAPATEVAQPLRLLVLGQMRADKGLGDLHEAVRLLPPETRFQLELVLCGRRSEQHPLPDFGSLVTVDDRTSTDFVDDLEIAAAVRDSHLLLAPLVLATASSTVVLGLTAGLGVLAYDGGEVDRILDQAGLVPTGDVTELAARISHWADGGPAGGPRHPMEEWWATCAAQWDQVLRD